MNANHELERRLADFYATEAPQRAPDRVLESVLATSDITRQRRAVFRLPWRFPIMNSYAKMAIAAVAVIAIGAVGLAVLATGRAARLGVVTPTASPTSGPSVRRSSELTESFTSSVHGISVSYPADWSVEAATEPWTDGCCPGSVDGVRDIIDDGAVNESLRLVWRRSRSAAMPVSNGRTTFWRTRTASASRRPSRSPSRARRACSRTAPMRRARTGYSALAWTQDRGYWIVLYRIDDRAWFDRGPGHRPASPGGCRRCIGTAADEHLHLTALRA